MLQGIRSPEAKGRQTIANQTTPPHSPVEATKAGMEPAVESILESFVHPKDVYFFGIIKGAPVAENHCRLCQLEGSKMSILQRVVGSSCDLKQSLLALHDRIPGTFLDLVIAGVPESGKYSRLHEKTVQLRAASNCSIVLGKEVGLIENRTKHMHGSKKYRQHGRLQV
jgi:hypothetical protein